MRIVEKKERKQRGGKYCLDYAGAKRCPHAKCPYIELDKYEDYEEYFATIDGDLRQLFKDIFKLDEGR